jgi:O-acetylhomoserine (thiol)-lyase
MYDVISQETKIEHYSPYICSCCDFLTCTEICDLEKIATLAHENGLPVIVDSTFSTPYLCRPFEFGCDIVVSVLVAFTTLCARMCIHVLFYVYCISLDSPTLDGIGFCRSGLVSAVKCQVSSLTKWVGGHGNCIGGIIVDKGGFAWGAGKHPLYDEPDTSYSG